jgi:hypothetical protein
MQGSAVSLLLFTVSLVTLHLWAVLHHVPGQGGTLASIAELLATAISQQSAQVSSG